MNFWWFCYCFHSVWNFGDGGGIDQDDFEPVTLTPTDYAYVTETNFSELDVATEELVLRREYKLEDFLWTGSGIGPTVSDDDGGLAWEDNAGGAGPVIQVTKTIVLFSTVLTTVYPVEWTPTVVTVTPPLSPSPSQPSVSLSISLEPSPTVSSPEPSPSMSLISTPEPEQIPTPVPDTLPRTNRIYWVNTVIKANGSDVNRSVDFEPAMEKGLAVVYASAFKRHLLNSLGILNRSKSSRRRRRNSDQDWVRFTRASSNAQIQALAAANISVDIVKIVPDDLEPVVSLEYLVIAEGKPVPGAQAAQDMTTFVSKEQMEQEIDYEVIKMAEALVQASQPQRAEVREGKTSPWIMFGVVTMILLVVIVLLLGIIAWKWKHKRITDRQLEIERRSPSSMGMLEGGVINPAFIGPGPSNPSRTETYHEHELDKESLYKSYGPGKRSEQDRTVDQDSLAKTLHERLVASDNQLARSPSSIKDFEEYTEGLSCTGSEDSIVIQPIAQRVSPRKQRAKTAVRKRTEHSDHRTRPLSATSREKVTFGHLDLCDDSVAKGMSAEAKKILKSRQPTAKPRHTASSALSSITPEVGDIGETLAAESDNVETPVTSSPKKDAQVQTPLRLRSALKRKPKAKPRRFTQPKTSAESLLSTESEEIIEVHTLDEGDPNTLGRMRKRFHQFLDDAFNVIGKKETEGDESRTKSAKVSLSHHIETKEISRPWTSAASNVILEETVESPRPKTATIGPPKRAWTASTQRCHSANSRGGGGRAGTAFSHDPDPLPGSDDEPDLNSSSLSTIQTPSSDGNRSYASSSMAPLFPRYPIYPDIPYPTAPETLVDPDSRREPAIPLIAAIKEEIKRFERVKVREEEEFHTRWST